MSKCLKIHIGPISIHCFDKDISHVICPSPNYNLYPNLLPLPVPHLYIWLLLGVECKQQAARYGQCGRLKKEDAYRTLEHLLVLLVYRLHVGILIPYAEICGCGWGWVRYMHITGTD